MKRILTLCVVLLLAATGLWAAGQTDQAAATGEPMAIEVMRGIGNALLPNPEDDYILQGLNDALNIDLTLTGVASEYERQLNVRIAGGDFPDVFASPNRNYFLQYVKDEVVMNLTPYESQLSNYLSMNPDAQKMGIVDGNRYSTATNLGINYSGFYIRKDWLDALGLSVPVTLEQFKEVAMAFTFNDPDGNGKDDTFGFGGQGFGAFDPFFGAFGVGNFGDVFVEDGSVVFSHEDPRYEQALAWVKDFVEAGVVDPNLIAVQAGTEVLQKQAQGLLGMVWSQWPQMRKPEFQKMLTSVYPDAEWILVEPPVGPDGYQNNGTHTTLGARIYYVYPATIEETPARRDKAIELVDYCASEPGYRLTSFGLEGTHYEVKEDGSLEALPRLFADGGYFWVYQFGGRKEVEYLMLKFAYAADEIEQNGNAEKIELMNNGIDIPEGYNHADAARYMEEETLKFVYGNRPLGEYDSYLDTLNATFGYDRYKTSAVEQLKALGMTD
jgi:putative aldouronate transport system substrate-binding protein